MRKLIGATKTTLATQQNKIVILNVLGAFMVKGGALLISVLLLPLYIKFFQEQEMLGLWYTILAVLNWVILFDFGLGQGLRNQLPKALLNRNMKLAKNYISTTYITMIFISVLILIIGIVIIPQIDLCVLFNIEEGSIRYSSLQKCVIIVFGGIILQLVLKIITSILYAMQKSAVVNALGLLTNFIILVILLVIPSRSIEENLITMSWINVLAANIPYLICSVVVFCTDLKDAKPSIKNFRRKYVKEIFNIGVALLWLQLVFMVVSSANEFLILKFTNPKYVVEYQAYYKIFKTAAMLVSLALTPIWSAVTKALVEKQFRWIKKVYILFLGIAGICFVGEICLIPFLQWGMDIWLGEGVIAVTVENAIIFALSSVVFVVHNVNTSVGNGMSYFRLQMVWMTAAAVAFIPCAWIFVQLLGSWIGVVLASVVVMAPYEILAPIFTIRKLNKLLKPEEVGI